MTILALGVVASRAQGADVAYRGIDVCKDVRADGRGIAALQAGALAVADAVRGLTIKPAAQQAYDFASDVIKAADFDQVLTTPLAKTLPDKSHAFALSGTPRPDRSAFIVDYHKATAAELPPQPFLGFALELDVRADADPVPGEEHGFGLGLRGRTGLGEFSHRSALRLGHGLLQVLAPQNLVQLPASNETKSGLDGLLLAELEATLPETTALARRYVAIGPRARIIDADATAHTDLRSRFVLKIDQLRQDHPVLGEFIAVLAQKLSIESHVVYQLSNGLILGELTLNSTDYSMELHLKTSDGKLLPYDPGGRAHAEAALDPASLRDLAATAVIDLQGAALGLHLTAKGVRVATSFHDGDLAMIEARLTAMPAPRIEGYALGFVPTWAISAAMPGASLDEVTRSLTAGLLRGSDGRGSFAALAVDSRAPLASRAELTSGTELVDNFYLTFGLSVVEKFLWPSRDVLADGWRLTQAFAEATAHDLTRLRSLEQALSQAAALSH